MSEEEKAERFVQVMNQMCSTQDCADDLSDDDLAEALCRIPHNSDIRSLEDAVIGAVLHRWRHPWKWRYERIKKWIIECL